MTTNFHLAHGLHFRPLLETQGRRAAIVMTATRQTVLQEERLRPADLESMAARFQKKRGENRWKIAGKRRNFSGVEIVAMHGFH